MKGTTTLAHEKVSFEYVALNSKISEGLFLSLISFYHDRNLISWRNFSRIIEKWTRNILVSNGWRQTRCEGKGRGSEGSGIGRSEIWFPILLSCGKSLWEKYRYHLIWVGRVQMSTSLVSADIHFVVNLGIWCFMTFLCWEVTCQLLLAS